MTARRPEAGASAGRASTPGAWRWLWVAALTAVVYVVKHGYEYGVGDHDEMLPQLFRMLDPDLYPRDWFVVEQGARFTVRTPFLWVLRVLCLAMPPWAAAAVLYVAGLVGVAAGVYALARALRVEAPAAALGTVVGVGLIPTWALSGSAIVYQTLVPELLAWAIAVPAVRLVVTGRPAAGGALLGASAYVQLLVGALTTGALGLAILLGALPASRPGVAASRPWAPASRPPTDWRGRWTAALKVGASSLAVALPFVVLILHDRATGPPVPAGGLSSYFLIVELRLPHHYLPSEFGLGRWARFGLVALAGGAGLAWLRWRGRPLVFVERFAAAVALACAVAWPLVEAADSLFVAQLQVFKATVPLVPLLTVATAAALVDALPAGLEARAGWPFRHPGAAWASTLGLAAVAALLVAAGPLRSRLGPLTRDADLVALEAWARANTPTVALFVVPPSNTSFRSGSRRSVAITYKPTSFQEGSTHVWYDRLLFVAPGADSSAALGFSFAEALDAAYARNDAADWRRLEAEWGVDYALVDLTAAGTPPAAEPVAAAGTWAIYRVGSR